MPLPPYIALKRPPDDKDRDSYQTLFAAKEGAVAAPTAALHFTPELMTALAARGIARETVTLHVGAGTFLPVKAEDTDGHAMHAEWGEITQATADALNQARARGGRIVAVGSTALRLLESAASPQGEIRAFSGETRIFITPGYSFRAVDAMITNFHLPRSTLFMLVSAFRGREAMLAAYQHAIGDGLSLLSLRRRKPAAAAAETDDAGVTRQLLDLDVVLGDDLAIALDILDQIFAHVSSDCLGATTCTESSRAFMSSVSAMRPSGVHPSRATPSVCRSAPSENQTGISASGMPARVVDGTSGNSRMALRPVDVEQDQLAGFDMRQRDRLVHHVHGAGQVIVQVSAPPR